MTKELVTIEEAAQRLKYSISYFRNSWPRLLPGIKPVKLGANRSIRFFWEDIWEDVERVRKIINNRRGPI